MAKLTKRVVDSAAPDPSGKQLIIWDSEVKGFALRVTPAGAKSYVLNYRTAEGRERRYTIGKHGSPWTCEGAREKAVDLLRDIAEGRDPMEDKREAREAKTIAELAELYLGPDGKAARPEKKDSSWKRDECSIRCHIVPLLGRKVAKSLTATDVERFQADVAAGKSKADRKTGFRGRAIVTGGKGTAARTVAALSSMLEFGVSRKLLPSNPAKGVKLFKGEKKERFLTNTEVSALAAGMTTLEDLGMLSPTMAAAVKLLLLTGCRKSEITTLRWDYVDLEGGRLNLPDSKTGARAVPLPAAASLIIADLPRHSEWVLPSNRTDGPIIGLQKAWEMVREWCGIGTETRLHDLRHSFASFAVSDGASLYLVGKQLGHAQSRTTERYAHLADDPVKAVADRTAGRIAAAMRGKTDEPATTADVVSLSSRKR